MSAPARPPSITGMALWLTVLAVLLAGCGNKGELYREPPAPPAEAAESDEEGGEDDPPAAG